VQGILFDRIGTALLALLLGTVIWVSATYQTDRPREDFFPSQIPIQVLNHPNDLIIVNEPVSTVRVRIRAFSSSWDTLTVADFAATADLTGLEEGMHVVPVEVSVSDPTVTLLSVHPQALYVRLERAQREVRAVTIELEGLEEVPLGFQATQASADPQEVTVSGAASQLARVAQVYGTVSVANQRNSIDRTIELNARDESGQVVRDVVVSPSSVRVRVPIERRENYREVAVRVRTTGQPARGYFVSSVNVMPATVTVVGPPDVIETMGSLIEVMGDLSVTGATRMIAARMELDLPEGVSVLGEQEGRAEVLVTVGIDAITGGTTVELPLRVQRLQEGLQVAPFLSMVDVFLTGPSVVLDELQTERLSAILDLSGLGPGTHQVRPQVEIYMEGQPALQDLEVRDIVPQFVEVTIEVQAAATPMPTLTPTPRPTATPRP
jgi:YbbR domain-containing protein